MNNRPLKSLPCAILFFLFIASFLIPSSPVSSGEVQTNTDREHKSLKKDNDDNRDDSVKFGKKEIIVHICGSPKDRDLAAGLGLMFQDKAKKTPYWHILDREKLFEAANKEGILQADDRIRIKDIPYYSLSTGASKIILGWVQRDGIRTILKLRSYDGLTGLNEVSEILENHSGDIGDLFGEAVKLMGRLIKTDQWNGFKEFDRPIGRKTVADMGRAWRMIEEDALDEAFAMMLDARDNGLDLPNLMRVQLQRRVLNTTKATIADWSGAVQGDYYNLTGDIVSAAAAYSGAKSSKTVRLDAGIRHGRMLARAKRFDDIRRVLSSLKRIAKNDGRIYSLQAEYYKGKGLDKKWKSSVKRAMRHGIINHSMAEEIAETFLADRNIDSAADTFRGAAKICIENELWEAASIANLKAAKLQATDDLFDGIFPAALKDDSIASLKAVIESYPRQSSRSLVFLKARIAEKEQAKGKAKEAYLRLAGGGSDHFPTYFAASNYLLENDSDTNGAEFAMARAMQFEADNPELIALQAKIFLKKQQCAEALKSYERYIEESPKKPMKSVALSKMQMSCEKTDKAKKTIHELLKNYPDFPEALVQLIEIHKSTDEKAYAKLYMDRLWMVDIRLAAMMSEEFKKESEALALQKQKEDEAREQAVADVKLPDGVDPAQLQQALTQVSQMDDAQIQKEGLGELKQLADKLGIKADREAEQNKQFKMDGASLTPEQISDLMGDGGAPDPEALKGMLDSQNASAGQGESLDDLLDPAQLAETLKDRMKDSDGKPAKLNFDTAGGGQTLGDLKKSMSKGGVQGLDPSKMMMMLKELKKEGTNMGGLKDMLSQFKQARKKALAEKRDGPAFEFNLELRWWQWTGIFVILGLVLMTVLFYYYRKAVGTGSVSVRIIYNSAMEEGFFAVRLSRKKLDEPFNTAKLMRKKFRTSSSSDDDSAKKVFRTLNPYIAAVSNGLAGFEHIPPGHYYTYIVGIMVNTKTHLPIGTHETMKEIMVRDSETARIEIDFEQSEAYVEILVRNLYNVAHTALGSEEEQDKEPVEVIINDDPEMKISGNIDEPIVYYLPKGNYKVKAKQGNVEISEDLVVEKIEPQTLELRIG